MSEGTEGFKCVRLTIRGRVQAVWYRGWCQDNALELKLDGWVRNRRDGCVEALFSGPLSGVDEMIERCRHGPSYAHVSDIEIIVEEEPPQPGFEIRATV